MPLTFGLLLRSEGWKEVLVGASERRSFSSFRQFLEEYIKATPEEVRGLIEMVKDQTKRMEALDAFDVLVRGGDLAGHGGDRWSGRARAGSENESQADIVRLSREGYGNSAQHALARLRRDRPDLHARVLSGELTPNAAAIEAGWRKRKIQVPDDDPQAIARVLRRRLPPEMLAEVAAALVKP